MRGLSTLTEILLRGKIHDICDSVLRPDRKIIIFASGDQANIDIDVYNKLMEEFEKDYK